MDVHWFIGHLESQIMVLRKRLAEFSRSITDAVNSDLEIPTPNPGEATGHLLIDHGEMILKIPHLLRLHMAMLRATRQMIADPSWTHDEIRREIHRSARVIQKEANQEILTGSTNTDAMWCLDDRFRIEAKLAFVTMVNMATGN